MLAVLISVIVAVTVVAACIAAEFGFWGTLLWGIAGFFTAQLLISYVVRKKITAVQGELQSILENGKRMVQRKIQQFQSKPNADIRLLQRQIEGDQKTIVTKALEHTARFEPFKKWSLLMGRQIATMRMQFHYQLKNFSAVDELLASGGLLRGPMMMEPMTVAMKMARQFKNGDIAGVEKTFKKRVKWFRGERGTLLYGVMSWVYMQQGEAEKARQLLIKGKEVTENETLAANWDLLSNGKEKNFSNAGLGEEWYGLYLEAPPMPRQQRIRVNPRSNRPF